MKCPKCGYELNNTDPDKGFDWQWRTQMDKDGKPIEFILDCGHFSVDYYISRDAKILEDEGFQENFMRTHTLCPDCYEKYYGEKHE